jgi:hypothetical protein
MSTNINSPAARHYPGQEPDWCKTPASPFPRPSIPFPKPSEPSMPWTPSWEAGPWGDGMDPPCTLAGGSASISLGQDE